MSSQPELGESGSTEDEPTQPNIQAVTIATKLGPVDVVYDMRSEGDTLHLRELLVYPRQSQPLFGVLRELLAARSLIAEFARETGYNRLRITGHRTLQSSSANPGKNLDITINLREG